MSSPLGPLAGRSAEQRLINEVTGRAAAGRGGALVLRGEAGIGKSALLAQVAQAASAFRLVRASGSEFEQELPYAACISCACRCWST